MTKEIQAIIEDSIETVLSVLPFDGHNLKLINDITRDLANSNLKLYGAHVTEIDVLF